MNLKLGEIDLKAEGSAKAAATIARAWSTVCSSLNMGSLYHRISQFDQDISVLISRVSSGPVKQLPDFSALDLSAFTDGMLAKSR